MYGCDVAKKATARRSAPPKSATRVAVALSLRPAIEQGLDAWREFEVDDDNAVVTGDRPYAREPKRSVDRLFLGLAELGIQKAAMGRLEEVRLALVALVQTTPLDDLDGETLLAWIAKEAAIDFVEDRTSLPAEARSELAVLFADVVKSAVAEGASIPTFARTVVEGLRVWAHQHGLDPKRLAAFEAKLANRFGGVVWYGAEEAQASLVAQLADDAIKLLKVRWMHPPPEVEPYDPQKRYSLGAHVSHRTFGIGEVVRLLDAKIEVRFDGGVRTLAVRRGD